MKSIVALLLLSSQVQAVQLPYGTHRALAQQRSHAKSSSNPETNDIMEFADDKEYMDSQKAILEEQNMHDTQKYSMSAVQYNSLMQKEKQKEMQEHEDQLARDNVKKLEQEIDNQRYQELVEMVQGQGQKKQLPDSKDLAKQAEETKKKAEELKKIEEEKKKQAESKQQKEKERAEAARLEEERKKKLEEEEAAKEHFNEVTEESAKKIDQMNVLVANFERSQKLEDYEKIKALHAELRSEYKLKPDAITINIKTAALIQSGFSEFPQIAHNDFTVDQLNTVRAAEENLNANTENQQLAQAYMKTVTDAQEKLKDAYKDYWQNPWSAKALDS